MCCDLQNAIFFKPQHLDVLKVLDVTCKISKYSSRNFVSHFELTSMPFPSAIALWELEIPVVVEETFLSPSYCLCCSALENRLYCLSAKTCLSLATYIFVHINSFFSSLA